MGTQKKQWDESVQNFRPLLSAVCPIRFTYDNNYFNDRYQGIPIGGYTAIIKKLLEQADVKLGTDYLKERETYKDMADRIDFYRYDR